MRTNLIQGMRPRIKKSTVVETKVEFCYSTVVTRANNSSSDVIKAELTRYNQPQGVVKCVEFYFFGQRVQKGLDWIEKLEAAGFEYTIIEK